jgi:small subunit ribosomal protein S1
MELDDDVTRDQGAAPPPPDEAWWTHVMKEEEKETDTKSGAENNYSLIDRHAGNPEDWDWAGQLYQTDDTVNLKVIGFNRGGLLVEAQSLRGFVPISHIVAAQELQDEKSKTDLLTSLVGSSLCLKVIEFDPTRGRLVFSQRAALAGPGERTRLLEELEPESTVKGKVTNITRFGVFVDLGGLEGLIHVSELSWGRVRHPEDVVKCGEELEVKVLSVDREQGRVALSLKELLPDPWVDVDSRYQIGDMVEGVVTNVVRFGAFVGLEEGLEGLIHVSELGEGSFLHPRSVLNEGELVQARVIHIDPIERRLGLSIRQLSQEEDESETPTLESSSEEPELLSSV